MVTIMLNTTVRRPKSTAQTPNRQHSNLNALDVHYKSHCFPGTIPRRRVVGVAMLVFFYIMLQGMEDKV